MIHPRQHISDLAKICQRKGLYRIIISPGSRSAPLISAFYSIFGEACISIVDERSAGYFALGIALHSQKPVALICTSGTAVLNYAPALAEAYYQKIPLLAITADRPHEWIDQQDNQTLRQRDIYHNFIKGSFELPQTIHTTDDLWYSHRMVNEAFDLCMEPSMGPVHINVPLTEPLYDELPAASPTLSVIRREFPEMTLRLPDELMAQWKTARKIMILHGQDIPGSSDSHALPSLLNDTRVVILAENIANMQDKDILSNSNILLSNARNHPPPYPDLILHSGGQIVSKALAAYLRKGPAVNCWRLGTEKGILDTFKQLTHRIPYPAALVYNALAVVKPVSNPNGYRSEWQKLASDTNLLVDNTLSELPFSDALVFKHLLELIPENTLLTLGNSSVIRYSQFFPAREKIDYYSNRGVSGIDGCLSATVGIASNTKQLTVAITGDLGFVYDSNSLWNNSLPRNLRFIVINNQGGGIFHILKGPADQPGFKKLIEANHPVNIHKLAGAFGLKYFFADSLTSLSDCWESFICDQDSPVILEVKTDAATSASTFRKLMSISGLT